MDTADIPWDGITYLRVAASRLPSGEKARDLESWEDRGSSRAATFSRVFESWICIHSSERVAINWPHGDHAALFSVFIAPVLAVHKSHEAGTPVTTFATRVQACWPYSLQTADDLGTS